MVSRGEENWRQKRRKRFSQQRRREQKWKRRKIFGRWRRRKISFGKEKMS